MPDFLASMAAVFVATQIQSSVLGWQVFALTGDALSLGWVFAAAAVVVAAAWGAVH